MTATIPGAETGPDGTKPKRAARRRPRADLTGTDAVETFGSIKLRDLAEPALRGRFRYCKQLGWLAYDGTKWAPEADDLVLDAIVDVVRDYTRGILTQRALTAADCKEIAGFSGPACQNHARTLLRARPGIVTAWTDFDAPPAVAVGRPWTVPCANGVTIELYANGTKKVRRTSPDDLNTMTVCAYDENATAPNIEAAFQLYQPDDNIRRYQRQMWCRALSGIGAENFIANLGEGGRNGKGTTAFLLKAVFGDYAQQIPVQVILRSHGDNMQLYRSELAGLRAKRYVCCEEPKKGAHYDEGMVKLLTGGGEINGRAMRRDTVTFVAKWLFELAANKRPTWDADDALAARYIEINWNFSIVKSPGGVQEDFKDRLRAEVSGLLNAILADWTGSAKPVMPEAVRKQTDVGSGKASALSTFAEAMLIDRPGAKIKPRALFEAYERWAVRDGLRNKLTETSFGIEMPRMGWEKKKTGGVTYYIGVGIRAEDGEEAPGEAPAGTEAEALPWDDAFTCSGCGGPLDPVLSDGGHHPSCAPG